MSSANKFNQGSIDSREIVLALDLLHGLNAVHELLAHVRVKLALGLRQLLLDQILLLAERVLSAPDLGSSVHQLVTSGLERSILLCSLLDRLLALLQVLLAIDDALRLEHLISEDNATEFGNTRPVGRAAC